MAFRKIYIKQLPTEIDLPSNRNKDCFFQNSVQSSDNRQILYTSQNNYDNKENYAQQSLIQQYSLQKMNLPNLDNRMQNQEQLQKQFDQNELKIGRLRNKLEQLFQHYQSQKKYFQIIRQSIKENKDLQKENQTLCCQIQKIRCMLKEALLVRQKMKVWE